MATSDPQVDSWREEFESLVQKVDGWFRQATTRFQRPSDGGCRMVAFYLMAFRHPVKDKRPDTRKHGVLGWSQALFRIKEAQRILATSRAGIYRDLAAGRLEAVKIGTATRITAQSLARRIAELPPAQVRSA